MNPISIGPHRLLCGDLTAGAVEALMGNELADLVYVDPPWGPGMLWNFATMARKGPPRLSWPDFLSALCATLVKHTKPEAPIFIEMGCRWVADLDAAMKVEGIGVRHRWEVTYGPKSAPRPSVLTLYGTSDVQLVMPVQPHGASVPQAVFSWCVRSGMVVLDPCTGLGTTGRLAHRRGALFRGVELGQDRLDRTAAWLRRSVSRDGQAAEGGR